MGDDSGAELAFYAKQLYFSAAVAIFTAFFLVPPFLYYASEIFFAVFVEKRLDILVFLVVLAAVLTYLFQPNEYYYMEEEEERARPNQCFGHVFELGSKEQQGQSRSAEASSSQQPWYSLVSSPSSSRPQTSSQIQANVSPGEAAGIIVFLKDKSVDELRKLLSDKDAYQQFLLSLDQVKIQNNIKEELRRETLQLARGNLEKELQITELRNQCRIIRTTELATAQEKLSELETQKEEILKFYSPASLLHKLQEAMNQADEESEALQDKFLDKEIDTAAFVQRYKKLRTTYHLDVLRMVDYSQAPQVFLQNLSMAYGSNQDPSLTKAEE